jgi:hypothetical protein
VTPKPPPDALGRVEPYRATAEAARQRARRYRAKQRRERRAWLVQCEECLAIATGRGTWRGMLVSQGFPIENGRHVDCGGRIRVHDIAEKDAAA